MLSRLLKKLRAAAEKVSESNIICIAMEARIHGHAKTTHNKTGIDWVSFGRVESELAHCKPSHYIKKSGLGASLAGVMGFAGIVASNHAAAVGVGNANKVTGALTEFSGAMSALGTVDMASNSIPVSIVMAIGVAVLGMAAMAAGKVYSSSGDGRRNYDIARAVFSVDKDASIRRRMDAGEVVPEEEISTAHTRHAAKKHISAGDWAEAASCLIKNEFAEIKKNVRDYIDIMYDEISPAIDVAPTYCHDAPAFKGFSPAPKSRSSSR